MYAKAQLYARVQQKSLMLYQSNLKRDIIRSTSPANQRRSSIQQVSSPCTTLSNIPPSKMELEEKTLYVHTINLLHPKIQQAFAERPDEVETLMFWYVNEYCVTHYGLYANISGRVIEF